jgi:hypothetical protein
MDPDSYPDPVFSLRIGLLIHKAQLQVQDYLNGTDNNIKNVRSVGQDLHWEDNSKLGFDQTRKLWIPPDPYQ